VDGGSNRGGSAYFDMHLKRSEKANRRAKGSGNGRKSGIKLPKQTGPQGSTAGVDIAAQEEVDGSLV